MRVRAHRTVRSQTCRPVTMEPVIAQGDEDRQTVPAGSRNQIDADTAEIMSMHHVGTFVRNDARHEIFDGRNPEVLMLFPRSEWKAIDSQPIDGVELLFLT